MRTEDDVRIALRDQSEAAVDPDLARRTLMMRLANDRDEARGRRRRFAVRVTAAGIAVAIVVAVAVLAGVLTRTHHDSLPPAVGTVKTDVVTNDAGGLRITVFCWFAAGGPGIPCADGQLYSMRAFDPTWTTGQARVSLGAHDGYAGSFPTIAACGPDRVAGIAWQLSTGQWVIVEPVGTVSDAQLDLRTIAKQTAAAYDAGEVAPFEASASPVPPKMPYLFGFVPHAVTCDFGTNGARLRPTYGNEVDVGIGPLDMAEYRSQDGRTTLTTAIYGPDALPGTPPAPARGSTTLVVDGHEEIIGATTIDVRVGPFAFHVKYSGPAATHADLVRVAYGLHFPRDISNHSTWFTDDESIPPRR